MPESTCHRNARACVWWTREWQDHSRDEVRERAGGIDRPAPRLWPLGLRIGLEAGPLSQWLDTAMKPAGLAVELLETRHVRDAFKAMPVKSDRNDARGLRN